MESGNGAKLLLLLLWALVAVLSSMVGRDLYEVGEALAELNDLD